MSGSVVLDFVFVANSLGIICAFKILEFGPNFLLVGQFVPLNPITERVQLYVDNT